MLNNVFANDVRQTLEQFRRSVDHMFENFYGYQGQPSVSAGTAERAAFSPALESAWNDQFLNLRAILPGVSENDVQVSVQNNQLVIEGERKPPEGFDKAWTQLAYGKFYAVVPLPAGLDSEHVSCRLRNGILDIQVPISEASKPKQIRIETGEAQKALNA